MTKASKKVIYVNFSPYDNTGKTLDFLIENFSFVAHFSFDHLRLKNNRHAHLSVYINGKCLGQKKLSWLKTHPLLLFPSLPFVALVMLAETFLYSYLITKQVGKIDYYMTVNAYPAVTGILLKKLGIVKKTVFWVWDYFPTNFPDWRMRALRKAYLFFDLLAIKYSDKIVYLNTFLRDSRVKIGHYNESRKYSITPIGTNPKSVNMVVKKRLIGHMGLIKESQGLDLLFENLDEFFALFPNYKIEIIGTGPEEEKYKRMSKKHREKVIFYGFMENANEIDKLISRWGAGLATYTPTEWSEHYWGDPSKIKAYISNGVPVITTSVPEFAKDLVKAEAGLVIAYKKEALFQALSTIIENNHTFSKKALHLSSRYDYRKVYKSLLD